MSSLNRSAETVEGAVTTFRDQPGERAVVRWLQPDGRVGGGSPLPVDLATAMLREYAQRYPERRYWLESARPEP